MAGLSRRPRHARTLGSYPERQSQKRRPSARHRGDQKNFTGQRSSEGLSGFFERQLYGSGGTRSSSARGTHALAEEIGRQAHRSQVGPDDTVHSTRRGGFRLATGRLRLASKHPDSSHQQAPPAAEPGGHGTFDP